MHRKIIQRLFEHGYEAYLVGGCVRDELLGLPVNDYDIATNATPDEVAELFKGHNVDLVGKTFGVAMVDGVEVATFRTETYNVPSKPDVVLARTFYEDAARRDFTINAMAKDINGRIIDYFGGQEDLQNKVIRAVGNPAERFKEDPSRILRALYLAARLDFEIEPNTFQSIKENIDLLQLVPVELVGKILMKVLKHNCMHRFMGFLPETGALKYVFPELVHTVGLPQNPKYHDANVYDHILRVVKSAETNHPGDIVMILSAVFHDVAKGMKGIRGVNKEGQPNDIGHEEAGVPIAKQALIRLQFGKEIAEQVAFIVKFHGIRLGDNPKRATVVRLLRKMSTYTYFKNKQQLIEGADRLINFMQCDADGFNPSFGAEMKVQNNLLRSAMMEVLENTMFYRHELPLNGNDLLQLGLRGKEVGKVLDILLKENVRDVSLAKKIALRYARKD